MIVSQTFTAHLELRLSDFFNERIGLTDSDTLLGGDINESFLLKTSAGNFFLKVNSVDAGADFFEKEAMGLATLRKNSNIQIPQPYFAGSFEHHLYLVMEYLEKGKPNKNFWEDFGISLANLHRQSYESFGLGYDNYIGRLPQSNRQHSKFAEFYAEERIMKLVIRANQLGLLQSQYLDYASRLCAKFGDVIPAEPPALLHGDLWAGNFIIAGNGLPAIYDPAIYYGHREIDLAMTRLFGGFENKFYDSYQGSYPLEPGWQNRIEIFQLYPLLVHLLLFGGHYTQRVASILTRYC